MAELSGLLAAECGLGEAEVAGCVGGAGPYVAEMCRVGGAEIHPTAATMGGMVSQELIKEAMRVLQDGAMTEQLLRHLDDGWTVRFGFAEVG